MKPLPADSPVPATAPRRRISPYALDALIIVVSVIALYLCAVVLPAALDNTIVYKGF